MMLIDALDFIYVPMYNVDDELQCIFRVPSKSSAIRVDILASERLYFEVRSRIYHVMTDAEAETLIEMGCCPLLEFNTERDLEALAPYGGYRDRNGQIEWRIDVN